jgi:hypothetical protein
MATHFFIFFSFSLAFGLALCYNYRVEKGKIIYEKNYYEYKIVRVSVSIMDYEKLSYG